MQISTGDTYKSHDFDIRRIVGEAMVPLEGEALEQSKKNKPSPMPFNRNSK